MIQYDEMLARAAAAANSSSTVAAVVPQIVHHTWKDTNVPRRWGGSYGSWKSRLVGKGWKFEFWTDDRARQLIIERFPWFLDTYDRYEYPIQRADCLRYFVLYEYGGVYTDLDVGLKGDLSGLLTYGVVLPETRPIGFSNDFLVSAKGHPFFLQVIQRLQQNAYSRLGLPYLTIMMSTGPLFLSLQLADYPRLEDVHVLAASVYGGQDNQALLFHVTGNSWHAWDAGYIVATWELLQRPIIKIVLIAAGVMVLVLVYSRCGWCCYPCRHCNAATTSGNLNVPD